jgi:hypothetical protein
MARRMAYWAKRVRASATGKSLAAAHAAIEPKSAG